MNRVTKIIKSSNESNQNFIDTFYDIKKFFVFLEENTDLYFIPYEKSKPYIQDMKQEIEYLYPSLDSQEFKNKLAIKQDEFIVSRWLYKKVCKDSFGFSDIDCQLKKNKDFSPKFFDKCCFSLSHKKGDVLLSINQKYRGIGVDVENPVRKDLASKILTKKEYSLFQKNIFVDSILLGLIFSFKESIFKATYPIVKKMLYFKDAHVDEIDPSSGSIQALLLFDDKNLKSSRIEGRFKILQENPSCPTSILTLAWIKE